MNVVDLKKYKEKRAQEHMVVRCNSHNKKDIHNDTSVCPDCDSRISDCECDDL